MTLYLVGAYFDSHIWGQILTLKWLFLSENVPRIEVLSVYAFLDAVSGIYVLFSKNCSVLQESVI